jgi:hypothetical protein
VELTVLANQVRGAAIFKAVASGDEYCLWQRADLLYFAEWKL